ncbi:MAG TPA: reverse transcriptase domain-containing protein [Ktedonobacteraceae bacterium]|nr:reverse transcriptase domain-containing protein [Ktedonobacteraceae bacterium]
MRTAETILGLIRERGKRGLPLERVYKLLFNKDLFLMAYGKIYRNRGAMTHGVSDETPDGMSLKKIDAIIQALRSERYQWLPARRTYIPKKNGKKRPLGMPVWSDKLVQEVIRLILEAYYEPQFSDHSHGFRPERGCHTALREIYYQWIGTTWFIEGDIAQCFDRLDHELLLTTLGENIHDGRFIKLMRELFDAGYMEEWTFNQTLSGVPQGGIVSPVLSNILLNQLDSYVETVLIPWYTKGTKRKGNPAYHHLMWEAFSHRQSGDTARAEELRKQAQSLPAMQGCDPDYRRLRYVRYADDFLLGFIGPRSEAEEIKQALREFLRDALKLELSEAKTLITHARSEAARFLGYEITTLQVDEKRTVRTTIQGTKTKCRNVNGKVGLRIPREVIEEKCQRYKRGHTAIHRMEMVEESDYTIITTYQLEYRGIVNYYRLALNMHTLSQLKWVMEQSLTKTLARKFNRTVPQIYEKYGAELTVQGRRYKGLQVSIPRQEKKPLVATWGGVPLIREMKATLEEQPPFIRWGYSELVQRLLADHCELCGSTEEVQVHHVHKMKNLYEHPGRPKPEWVKRMIALKRKTLLLCRTCHEDVDRGRPLRREKIELAKVKALQKSARTTILESRMP